jgi:hypothetical protein
MLEVSVGYIALWKRNRLDLTVESLILGNEWLPLFSDLERDIARQTYGSVRIAAGVWWRPVWRQTPSGSGCVAKPSFRR